MNRLHQLKETLLQNIKDNEDYDDLEFIVLDYNSQDGMEEWIKATMYEYILSGRMIYYKTNEPKSWSPSHSKNIALKLATGYIICSTAADNYTGPKFAQYVNDQFKQGSNIVLTPIDFHRTKKNYHPPSDVFGNVCVRKDNFIKIGGFDERMDRYGFEDYDLISRLEMNGLKRVLIEDFSFFKYVPHDNNQRYLLPIDNLEAMYINYLTPFKSEILFLSKNKRFEKGVVIDNFIREADNPRYAYETRVDHFEYSLEGQEWELGSWEVTKNNEIQFSSNNITYNYLILREYNQIRHTETNTNFYRITNEEVIDGMLRFKHFIYTRSLMEENIENKTVFVNNGQFGKATVFKNFQLEPLSI